MATCFVIQPFDDGGRFDKRFEDVIDPAIRRSNSLEPYRVDRDPGTVIPVEDIQRGIEAAAICLADITTDNPNVWFELGYALAARKEVVLICDYAREKFPFDVQHRKVIRYRTESPRDFEKLGKDIEERIKATLKRQDNMQEVAHLSITASMAKVEGLEQHQMAALVAVAEQETEDPVDIYAVVNAMEGAGFTKIATIVGLKALCDRGMMEEPQDSGIGSVTYRLTDAGWQWLFSHAKLLKLRKDDADIPF